jgi:hypothetical protein
MVHNNFVVLDGICDLSLVKINVLISETCCIYFFGYVIMSYK